MKITDTSIQRPMLVAVLVTVLLILGGVSLSRLAIDLWPEMNLPVAAVVTEYPGAGPEEVEQQVTRPLESILATVSNLDTIRSTSSMGTSTIILMFDWGTDMNYAALQIREKVDIIRQYLPSGVKTPMTFKMDPNMMPIMQLALSSEDPRRLKQLTDDVIQPRLERVGGVASVWSAGGVEREIRVLVDPERLAGYGLTLNGLTQALSAENLNVSGGTVQEGTKDLLVRVTGEFRELDQVRRAVVGAPGGHPVHLGDVARVEDGHKKITQFSRVDGKPGLSVYIQKQSGANTVQVARAVHKTLDELKKELPGVRFDVVMDQSEFIERSINHVVKEILVGGFLAMLVMWIFLRNLRSTLIISTSIPISIIGTFVLIYFNDMTLNLITMGGLALGVGLIVDDAIVVLENIYRHRQLGYGLVEAARVATDEVGGAVIASTLTTMAVFLPVVFVKGLAAQLFTPLALTVSFAIFTSLVVALTLVPLMASRWLHLEEESAVPVSEESASPGSAASGLRGWRKLYKLSERWFNNLNNAYRRLLEWALNHRRRVIIIVSVLFVLSLAAFPLVGFEFMPSMDQGQVSITVEMPRGTSLEETNRVATRIEKMVQDPWVESIFTGVGFTGTQGMWGESSTDVAQITLQLVDKSRRSVTADEVAEILRQRLKEIPGAKIKVSTVEEGGGMMGGGAPVQIQVRGDDMATLTRLGDRVAELVRRVPGTREVASSLQEGRPEVQVLVHRDRAAAYGLSPAEVASTVRTAVDGTVATRYRTGGEEVDIRVQLRDDAVTRLPDLSTLTILSPTGASVPLSQVAEIVETRGPHAIDRQDQTRLVTVTAQLAGRDLGSVIKDIQAGLKGLSLPPGYTVEFSGEQEQMAETFGDLSLALVLAVVLVYLVMVAQFESALYPFIIMFSVPVTMVGVTFSLLVTGRAFSVPAFIGLIMLVGIVVKNAIVFVDYVNILRRRGLERREAILKAGPTRLRPILMTALTAILAMLPMALGIGEGSEGQAPMATVVAGGLAFSTLITLVLVPVIYTILDDWRERWQARWSGRRTVPLEAVNRG
ncbi:efflux RND transporter permease subunit [Desulfofundulus thermosubterraneus]|uniref:Hydrophobic/amphiphilic exporter-1, HAE1 family n=1 Tax=Desulfofundulus thermosubterraneus DSM 16057 TaxID=1121432 RepID=A0A1M6I0K6_9FIRM|nr:efflux RND transporter permease subunit [Desulfofundulus thermosubterraneus]SHJ27945.1 hydrophobic/amphiphilic exporter-1, HAE1 family [Desulfofundulus thermosubterraneus DSM 16057]